ncbi:MAG: type II toxin-antitoxin system RelE/ParE family toxin [Cryomorphaceae bacterium]
MALELIWTQTAERQLDRIIEYLQTNWTEREISQFFKKLEKGLETIRTASNTQKKSHRKAGTFEYQISPQTTIFYTFDDKKATILLLWSNRMNPENI